MYLLDRPYASVGNTLVKYKNTNGIIEALAYSILANKELLYSGKLLNRNIETPHSVAVVENIKKLIFIMLFLLLKYIKIPNIKLETSTKSINILIRSKLNPMFISCNFFYYLNFIMCYRFHKVLKCGNCKT